MEVQSGLQIDLSKAKVDNCIIAKLLTCFVENVAKARPLPRSYKSRKIISNHIIENSCKGGQIATLILHTCNQFVQQITR
jgi:hypothetical protein